MGVPTAASLVLAGSLGRRLRSTCLDQEEGADLFLLKSNSFKRGKHASLQSACALLAKLDADMTQRFQHSSTPVSLQQQQPQPCEVSAFETARQTTGGGCKLSAKRSKAIREASVFDVNRVGACLLLRAAAAAEQVRQLSLRQSSCIL